MLRSQVRRIDLILSDPHISVDADDAQLQALADKVKQRNLAIGTLVAPVWPPLGGGSSMGDEQEREQFLQQVENRAALAPSFVN